MGSVLRGHKCLFGYGQMDIDIPIYKKIYFYLLGEKNNFPSESSIMLKWDINHLTMVVRKWQNA